MGFGTTLYTKIYFSKEIYKSKREVEDAIKEVNDIIGRYKEELKTVALITEPKKFIDDEEDPIWWIKNKVEDALDSLENYYIKLYKLERLLEDWDKCHQACLELLPPKNSNNCYIQSDFCDGIYPDGTEYKFNEDI